LNIFARENYENGPLGVPSHRLALNINIFFEINIVEGCELDLSSVGQDSAADSHEGNNEI
jgi:hypothetical protein